MTGRQLEGLIKYVDNKEVKHIDDCDDDISLETLKDEILQNNGVIYIALSTLPSNYIETKNKLIQKCKQYNLKYKEDMVLEYAKRAIDKLALECKNKGWNRIFALVMANFANDKHFGFLDMELEQRGEKILYFCSHEESYKRILEKHNPSNSCILHLSYEYLYLLEFVDVICVTGSYKYPKAPKIVFLSHAITNYGGYEDEFLFDTFGDSYICVAGDDLMPREEIRDKFNIIKSGYLAYDRDVKNLNNIQQMKNSVLFAPYDLDELREFAPLMKDVSSKYQVILRHRYEWEESHLHIIGELKDNIYIDKSNPMDHCIYGDSFVLVCSKTTTKNSFPIMSLSPSIVIKPTKWNHSDINADISIVVDSMASAGEGALLKLVDDVYINKDKWRDKIKLYRDSKIYNFGKTSSYLADFLIKEFGKDKCVV